MADRAQFQKKLGELLAVAASQNNKMTSQEVQAFFQDDNLTDEQMNLVHEFLMSQKVEVIGYTGTIENTEKTEQEEKDTLSQQEKDYVAEYLIDIEKMAKQTEEEVTLAYYLPKVVEEAVKLHMPGIFIGDVIQEGNVSLMLYLGENKKATEAEVLPQRPITAYLRELTKKGIAFEYHNTMPFSIDGALQSGVYELEGDVSSQYVTGLLFALPLLDGDSEIRMLSRLESKPYVDLTIACLRHFGVTVYETEQGYTVPGGQQYHACDMEVEGDYSQAAFFYVANALGSDITLTNLNPESVQGDKKIVEITQQMCYNREKGLPACFDVDAADIPDLVPILAVLATFGTAPSRITGAHRLAIKESDRLASTADLLNRLGGKVTATADGLEIEPVEQLHGGTVDSCGDHRIAMCAAVAATRCTGEVTILHGECVEKSYPRFYEDYRQLGGIANVIVLES